jgi:PAS domain-containing protein
LWERLIEDHVQDTRFEGRFREDDAGILSTIAANVGTAIRNASLFDEIKRSQQYYEAVIQNSPVAIVTQDLSMDVSGWNPAAEKLFGYSTPEAIGNNLDDLVATLPELHDQARNTPNRLSIGKSRQHAYAWMAAW